MRVTGCHRASHQASCSKAPPPTPTPHHARHMPARPDAHTGCTNKVDDVRLTTWWMLLQRPAGVVLIQPQPPPLGSGTSETGIGRQAGSSRYTLTFQQRRSTTAPQHHQRRRLRPGAPPLSSAPQRAACSVWRAAWAGAGGRKGATTLPAASTRLRCAASSSACLCCAVCPGAAAAQRLTTYPPRTQPNKVRAVHTFLHTRIH